MPPDSSADLSVDHLADRIGGVERSKIRVMFDLARRLDDRDLVHLEIGEPDFDTPEHITEAAYGAARGGKTHYTPNAGTLELRRAIAKAAAKHGGDPVDPETEVVVTAGAMEALHLLMLTLVNPGDEVIVPSPSWPNYEMQVKLAGGRPIHTPLSAEQEFDLDPERIEDALSDDTAVVVLTTPSNPTGRVYDRDAVEAVVAAAADHDAYVIADEVYRRLTYTDRAPSLATATDHPNHVITVDSCSKSYAMTGWRVGWLIAPEEVATAVTTIHESTTACAASVSQHAAVAALTGPQAPVEEMRAAFGRRRDYVVDRIADIPKLSCPEPEGAFYAFVDVSKLRGSSFDIAKRLLYDYGVVTAPGEGFGDAGRGYLRLSFANSLERLETGLDRVETMVEKEEGPS
ncbi:pyridoxal phosphate-dependent aminotransferase [Halegenticoccus tardaugens]|uniref:pyridoxal phosphate-dependent aminotransferase n=1 Tax=Halegenticoccus tardaugens TaxID=2071624 RepID=UPI00100A242C|nr:pyridoxal phosphate-dependent aminotransferase [Halegenticoccus tardaugens]